MRKKKPLTPDQIKRLRDQIRVDNLRRSFQEPIKVTLPRFSWDRGDNGRVQEQETNV